MNYLSYAPKLRRLNLYVGKLSHDRIGSVIITIIYYLKMCKFNEYAR